MGTLVTATVVAKNYLSFARVLAESVRRWHPDLPFFVLLVDEPDGRFDPAGEPFPLLQLSQLGSRELEDLRHRRSCKELATSAKAYLLQHLLDRAFRSVVFLDPDVLVLGDLTELLSQVATHDITLTPHLLGPLRGDRAIARELNVLQSGVFNAGFIGVSDGPSARSFLGWWRSRVHARCGHEVAEGVYYDQLSLNLTPAFFDGVSMVRDPGCNVGHWNLPERELRFDGDTLLAGGRPCRFFHFSGFQPHRPHVLSRYAREAGGVASGALEALLGHYADLLVRAGYDETRAWPYTYDGILRSAAVRAWRVLASRSSARRGRRRATDRPGCAS
jgi:hypothetical protein